MKRILITGAASGLGLALAKKYASEGWSVCLADIQDEEGMKIASQRNEAYGNDCFFQHQDITSDTLAGRRSPAGVMPHILIAELSLYPD